MLEFNWFQGEYMLCIISSSKVIAKLNSYPHTDMAITYYLTVLHFIKISKNV